MGKCGIYCITNIKNGKFYIGSSVNIIKRISQHKRNLQNQKHANSHLQNAYNKYGSDAFRFEVILECDFDTVKLKEQEILDEIAKNKAIASQSYNINMSATGGVAWADGCPQNVRNKLSKAMKGRKISKETRNKMSKAQKGRHVSEETKNKLSNAAANRIISEETRAKISNTLTGLRSGEKHPLYGKKGELSATYGRKHTEEEKKKMSEACKGRYIGDKHPRARKIVRISLEGESTEVFTTIKQAAEAVGRTYQAIYENVKGNTKHCGVFRWMYYEDYIKAYGKEKVV